MAAQARRLRRPLSLVFVDSDSLKQVNDRFGHAAGDRFVIELVETIRHSPDGVRASDVVVRYTGGDEFIVLMPDTDTDQAQVVAERLRAAIDQPFHAEGETLPCSASLGVATYPDDAETAEDLIRCADRAMYEAKRRGKNRVVTYRALAEHQAPPLRSMAAGG
jgi:diguanylate cyclase (GGDEF)-like protein